MRILHVNGFSDKERREKIEDIKKNIRDAILVSCAILVSERRHLVQWRHVSQSRHLGELGHVGQWQTLRQGAPGEDRGHQEEHP